MYLWPIFPLKSFGLNDDTLQLEPAHPHLEATCQQQLYKTSSPADIGWHFLPEAQTAWTSLLWVLLPLVTVAWGSMVTMGTPIISTMTTVMMGGWIWTAGLQLPVSPWAGGGGREEHLLNKKEGSDRQWNYAQYAHTPEPGEPTEAGGRRSTGWKGMVRASMLHTAGDAATYPSRWGGWPSGDRAHWRLGKSYQDPFHCMLRVWQGWCWADHITDKPMMGWRCPWQMTSVALSLVQD